MPDPAAPIPPEAIAVLNAFIVASAKKDVDAMRACLTQKTIESGQFSDSGPEGVRFVLGDASWEGDNILIPLRGFPIAPPAPPDPSTSPDPSTPPTPVMEMPALLTRENGQWKFDLIASMERMFGNGGVEAAMEKAMGQAVEALGTAMQGVTESLGTVMNEAFGRSTDSAPSAPQNWLEAPTAYAPEELLPLPKLEHLQKMSAAFSAALGWPIAVSAAMDDLLYQLCSDDRPVLMNWLDDSLLNAWPELFTRVQTAAPFTNRLRGIRLEPAVHTEQRMFIIDGNDLVCRMWLNTTNGYYSDAQMLDLLPGLMASLPPTAEAQTEGHRLIHTDSENADLEIYKTRVTPRAMRRISQLLGKNIELEANVDDIYNPAEDGRQLFRWGINRIHGGIALACKNDERKTQLAAHLKKIHLIIGGHSGERFAICEDGILTVSAFYVGAESGCFYERDIDQVLNGNPIEPPPEEPAPEEDETSDESEGENAAKEDSVDQDPEESENDAKETPEPSADEAAKAQALNDENFRTAVDALKPNEPMWATQLTMILNRPITLELNFDSLEGHFPIVQPFIHQALTATLEAITQLAFDPGKTVPIPPFNHVRIHALPLGQPCTARFESPNLDITVPITLADVRPPTPVVIDALRILNGLEPLNPPVNPQPEPPQQNAEEYEPAMPPFEGNPYAYSEEFIQRLEAEMRHMNIWPGEKPPGEIEIKGAFGCENMPFQNWLAWVLIPRVQEIINTQSRFPHGSQVTAYAVRALDGLDNGKLIAILSAFDGMVSSLSPG